MKYKFDVMVALTYEDKDIEVEIDLSDDEVTKVKQYVGEYLTKHSDKDEDEDEDVDEDVDENEFHPAPSLLLILEEKDEELFDKFWWDVIYTRVFVMILIDGFENGYIEKYEEDDFDYENLDDFDDICDMYSDAIELEHSSSCICKIPEWATVCLK